MINHETEVKLQACLDGELSPGEATTLEKLIAGDPDARSLFEELRATRTLLAGNELDLKLPDKREFYWSKIRRQIELEERRTPAGDGPKAVSAPWVRFLTPAGALAALVVLVVIALKNSDASPSELALEDSHEIETPLEETSSFSFRSEAAAMTVVWVDSHRE